MKRVLAFLFGIALASNLTAATPPPYLLTIPTNEVRLIPVTRLTGIPSDWIFIPPPSSAVSQIKFLPSTQSLISYELAFGFWVPSEPPPWFPGEGCVSGSNDEFPARLAFQAHFPPQLPLHLAPGLNLVACQSDIQARFEDIVGLPPLEGTVLARFNGGTNNFWPVVSPAYTLCTFSNGAWSPEAPLVDITEAVFILQPPSFSSIQLSPDGPVLEITAPPHMTLTIQSADSLVSPAWHTLTSITGSGSKIRVTDSRIGNSTTQRFYRAKLSQ